MSNYFIIAGRSILKFSRRIYDDETTVRGLVKMDKNVHEELHFLLLQIQIWSQQAFSKNGN